MALKDFAEIAQSASIILASCIAIYGIDAWRREFVGKRRMELAEEVLSLFYQARDIIEAIRSPFGYGGEGESRKPGPNEAPEHKQSLDRAFVLIERYNRHTEIFSRIHALRYRFMAQFGATASKPFDDLNRLVNELILSAHSKARLSTLPEWSIQPEAAAARHTEQYLEVDRIYYGGGQDDPISPRVEAIVSSMESTCKAIIESKWMLFPKLKVRTGKGNG